MITHHSDAARASGAVNRLLSPSHDLLQSPLEKVLKCLVIACLVTVLSEPLLHRFKEALDAAVQGALLQRLPLACETGKACDRVVLVTIDDDEFRRIFKQRSPLDPVALTALVKDLAQAGPAAVIFDLDMAPASDETAELDSRSRLKDALLALGHATQGRTVLACPQGFATPAPSPQDVAWVAGFEGSPVRFASAEIDSAGLYFYPWQRPLAAVGVAGLPGTHGEPAPAATSAHHDCRPAAASAQSEEQALIRPQRLRAFNITQARENPGRLVGKVVVVGGAYGVSDRFSLRGIAEPVYGVELHGWIAGSEFEPVYKPSLAANLWLDIAVGLLTGALFSAVWSRIQDPRSRRSFARRALFYVLFLMLAVGAPAALLLTAVGLAQYNIFISSAAMMVSVIFDGILSSHEELLDGDSQQAAPGQQAPAMAATGVRAGAHGTAVRVGLRWRGAIPKLLLSALALGGGALGFALLLRMRDPTSEAICAGLLGVATSLVLVWLWPSLTRWVSAKSVEVTTAELQREGPQTPSLLDPPLSWDRLALGAWLLIKVGVVSWVLLFHDSEILLTERLAAVVLVVALLAGAGLATLYLQKLKAAGERQPEAAT